MTFGSTGEPDAWAAAIESCVGERWEESEDPVEHVTVEEVEIDAVPAASVFRFLFAHSSSPEPQHEESLAFVHLHDVLVMVSVQAPPSDPYDHALLDDVLVKAVDKAREQLGV